MGGCASALERAGLTQTTPRSPAVILQALRHHLAAAEVPEAVAAARQAACARLDRDLLARLGGPSRFLVVGLIGPNNAGKSTLFTSLSGTDASPASPHGGSTRHLVGAVHPKLGALLRDGVLARFDVREHPQGPLPEDAPAHALFLAESDTVPEHLVLIDAPDVDSIHTENRAAAEALVVTADVLIAVVTRHTYNNHAIRAFLERAAAHGRPYLLVYNEAADLAVAAAHVAQIQAAIGRPALGCFAAPHDLGVQDGTVVLEPRELGTGEALSLGVLGPDRVDELALRAQRASLVALADEVAAIRQAWWQADLGVHALNAEVEGWATAIGARIAAGAFPLGPLADAFRTVLDRRGGAHQLVRAPFGWLVGVLGAARRAVWQGVQALQGVGEDAPGVGAEATVHAHEREALGAMSAELAEGLTGVRSAYATGLRPELPVGAALALDADTDPSRLNGLAGSIADRLEAEANVVEASYRDFCEREVEAAIAARGGDQGLQWAATGLASLPGVIVVAEVVATGGLGTGDIAATLAAALTAPVWQALVDRLGRDLVVRVREAWIARRGASICDAIVAEALPATLEALQARGNAWVAHGEPLAELELELRAAIGEGA